MSDAWDDETESQDETGGNSKEEASQEGNAWDLALIHRAQAPGADRRAPRHLWLVSYSDFMTILMIFFLAMYGYTYLAKAALVKMQKQSMTYSDFAQAVGNMQSRFGDQLAVENKLDKVVVQLGEGILFASGRAELTTQAAATLAELADSIKLIEGKVIVEGHTDNFPIKHGPYRTNWELSAARAFSVIEAFSAAGVPSDRLSAWGFGEHRPVQPNDTDAGRTKNRRIEITVLKKKTP